MTIYNLEDFDRITDPEFMRKAKEEALAKRIRLDKNPRSCSNEDSDLREEAAKKRAEVEELADSFDPNFNEVCDVLDPNSGEISSS